MRNKEIQSTYNAWASMIQRCENSNLPDFKNWGGRGINVCPRWRTIVPRGQGFKNFLEDMGIRPYQLTLDRINNDGNYEPSNCRWATRKEQYENSRRSDIMIASIAHAKKKRSQTHCKRGHQFSPENTYIYNNNRNCKTCRLIWDRYDYHGRPGTFDEFSKKFDPNSKLPQRPKNTHCKNGHEYTKENIYITTTGRRCKICVLVRQRKPLVNPLE